MTDVGDQPTGFFSYGLKFSILLHIVLVLWMVAHWAAESIVRPSDRKLINNKKSIRVDVVDLPTLKMHELNKVDLTKEAAPTPPKEEKKVEPAPTPPPSNAMKLPGDKKTEKKPETNKRLEEIQKNIRAEAKRQEILAKYKNEQKKTEVDTRPVLGGNILSKGGSVQGDVADQDDEYKASIQTHVRKFWKAPPWATGQNLKARVAIKLSPAGRVLSKQISRTSGRPEFDASALEAVEAADPFPPPVNDYLKRIILQEGIECGFPE